MNKQLIFFILLIGLLWPSFSIEAAGPKLPSGLYSINDLVGQFRNPLKTKLEDLVKNYRAKSSPNFVEYSSFENVFCLFRVFQPDVSLTKVEYFFRKSGKENLDVIRYFGCGGELSLVERFVRVGSNEAALTFDQFTQGKRDFNLSKDLESYFYELQNQRGETLFSLSARWANEAKSAVIYSFLVRGQEAMLIRYDTNQAESRVSYTFRPFFVSYQFLPYFKLDVSQNFDAFTFQVISKRELRSPIYLSSRGTQLSENSFLQFFSRYAIQNTLSNVKKMVDFHLFWFPPTEFVNTGGQGQRLLNELRLNLNRVLNNTNTNLVEVYLRGLIQSVENGLILDRRPVEQ